MLDVRDVIAQNLRLLMEAKKINQTQLARGAGVRQGTISYLLRPETGKQPKIDTVQAVARYFRVPVWRLHLPAHSAADLLDPLFGEVLEDLQALDQDGRRHVRGVSEREARYQTGTVKPRPDEAG